jgi:hypothetical protein
MITAVVPLIFRKLSFPKSIRLNTWKLKRAI